MDQLQLTPAKLLYQIRELFRNDLILENERISLKELVIQDDPSLYQILELYEREQNVKEFSENLIARVRFGTKIDIVVQGVFYQVHDCPSPQSSASPFGLFEEQYHNLNQQNSANFVNAQQEGIKQLRNLTISNSQQLQKKKSTVQL